LRIAIYENLPLGGARRASFELGLQLARYHEVDLYRLNTYSNAAMDLGPHVKRVHVYPYRPLFGLLDRRLGRGQLAPRSYTLFAPLQRLQRRIADDIRAGGFDVVLAHTDGMTQAPYLLRWLSGTRSVYFCQEVLRVAHERAALDQHRAHLGASSGLVGPLRKLEDGWVLRRLTAEDARNARSAGQIVVNSRYSRERVWAAYARDADVCYLGVDVERFVPDATTALETELLSIGSPVEGKGHLVVIEALGRMPGDVRPGLRVILPRPAGAEMLERAARERGVALSVEVGVDEATLISRYRAALATVCAARLEPFGLTALESMACGTPVIAVREGGFQESVLDGATGFLIEPGPDAIANAVARLRDDPELASRMRRAAREHVLRWTWEKSGRRLEAILQAAAA
jgi:glycosyltransferase involved in cell wall biosynthesis